MYVCKRCGNNDQRYLGMLNGKLYCRKCINFNGKMSFKDSVNKNAILNLDFSLSDSQKNISLKLKEFRKQKKNVFLYAVTGAGKTELVYGAILDTLKEGGKVGFLIPRKDVVIDLYPRIKNAFPFSKVVAVYGGHTDILDGDIIILTTHQVYRYNNYFDYLVFDEIDAFPYVNNEVLNYMFLNSIKGNYVLMSATPKKNDIDKILEEGGEYLCLTKRYHGGKLIVPKVYLSIYGLFPILLKILNKFINENKPTFIFAPTIEEGEKLFKLLNMFFKDGNVVHSKNQLREKIISDFKSNKYKYLVTTSILERGVTVKNLQVVVYHADHELFDSTSLIQISGRVGRKSDAKEGEVYFLAYKNTIEIEKAINDIKKANE